MNLNIETLSLKHGLILFLIAFIVADFSYSFVQHYFFQIDGDVPGIVVPSTGYTQVLKDPIGLTAILEDTLYSNPNRFFAHASMHYYFNYVPEAIQTFTSSITSVYMASGLAKTLFQILLVWMIASYITGSVKINPKFILAAALVVPLFQTRGFNAFMGVLDSSISYSFFYAFPMGLLLLFYFPFYRRIAGGIEDLKISFPVRILLLMLCFILAFHGPIIPASALVVCVMVLTYMAAKHFRKSPYQSTINRVIYSIKEIPVDFKYFFGLFIVLSLYSLYIGTYNLESLFDTIPIGERYRRLPVGIFNMLTTKVGFPLFLAFVGANAYIISRINKNTPSAEGDKILCILKWIGLFALVFILLLPLGGYRQYRPNIVRYDSIMPIMLSLFYFFGLSSFYLLRNLKAFHFKIFASSLVIFLAIFSFADGLSTTAHECERAALEKIAASDGKVVELDSDCTVLSWYRIKDPEDSELHGRLLQIWGITEEKKLYHQK